MNKLFQKLIEYNPRILRIIMKFFYIDGYCKKCGYKLDTGYHGEYKGSRCIKWCHKCYRSKFISEVVSSSTLLGKYYKIYSKHPKYVIHNQ